jgi:hypothetical protein
MEPLEVLISILTARQCVNSSYYKIIHHVTSVPVDSLFQLRNGHHASGKAVMPHVDWAARENPVTSYWTLFPTSSPQRTAMEKESALQVRFPFRRLILSIVMLDHAIFFIGLQNQYPPAVPYIVPPPAHETRVPMLSPRRNRWNSSGST